MGIFAGNMTDGTVGDYLEWLGSSRYEGGHFFKALRDPTPDTPACRKIIATLEGKNEAMKQSLLPPSDESLLTLICAFGVRVKYREISVDQNKSEGSSHKTGRF